MGRYRNICTNCTSGLTGSSQDDSNLSRDGSESLQEHVTNCIVGV